MKILHISAAILGLLLVFVSIVRASEAQVQAPARHTQEQEDQILDDLDGALNQVAAEPPKEASKAHQAPESKDTGTTGSR